MNKPIYGEARPKPTPPCAYIPPIGKNINEYLTNLNDILSMLNRTNKPGDAISGIQTLETLIIDALNPPK